jgi:membrane protein required for colicin V production
MSWLDIVILVALIIPAFIGLKQGLIKAAFSLAGLIIGVVLAGNFYQLLSKMLGFLPNEDIANIIAFTLILVGTLVIATVLAHLLKFIASVMMLGWVNHLGGAVFGFMLGAIFVSALLTIWIKFLGIAEIISEANLAVILLDRFPTVLALLPEEFDAIRSFFQ